MCAIVTLSLKATYLLTYLINMASDLALGGPFLAVL